MTLVTQAEYARRLNVSRATVSQWKAAKKLTMEGSKIDVEKSDAHIKKYRRAGLPAVANEQEIVKRGRPSVKQQPVNLTIGEIIQRLADLDYTCDFIDDDDVQDARAYRAAECLGWDLVTSEIRDDTHWGEFQLRLKSFESNVGEYRRGAIVGGFGFEIAASEVIEMCRDYVTKLTDERGDAWQSPDETVMIRLDLLPDLARPLYLTDRPT